MNFKKPLFNFDSNVSNYNTIRFDKPEHPYLLKSLDKMLGFFWHPSEVSLIKDKLDFQKCNESEKRVFIRNIQRQTFLDSIQSKHICNSISSIVENNELTAVLSWWSSFECLHSMSYSYILQAIFEDPSPILDEIEGIQYFQQDADNFDLYFSKAEKSYDDLYLALICSSILEGVQFMSSFLMSFAFVENRRLMNGNANILKLILRDENLHLNINNYIINQISKHVSEDAKNKAILMYKNAVKKEELWVDYLFRDEEIIGLTAPKIKEFINYICQSRMKNIHLEPFTSISKTPFKWFSSYAFTDELQVAPQELELTAYSTSNITIDEGDLVGISL